MKIKKYVFVAFMLLFSFELYSQSHRIVAIPSMGIDTLKMRTFLRECDTVDRNRAINADFAILKTKFRKAFGVYKKLNKRYSNVYLTKKCGDIMLLRKKYDKSLEYFNNAIERDSLYLMAYLSKINALRMLRRSDEIKLVYNKIQKLFPYNKKLAAYLIVVDVVNEDYIAAAKRIVEASKVLYNETDLNTIKPLGGIWYDVLSSIEEKELDQNLDLAKKIVSKDMKICLGCNLEFSELLEKYPNSIAVGKLYLYYFSDFSKNKQSEVVFNKLEKKGVVSFWQYWRLAEFAAFHKDFKKAYSYCTKAIKLNDTISGLFYKRACVSERLKNYQDVYDDASKAISLSSDKYNSYCERAFASIQMGNSSLCISDAKKALQINEKDTRAHVLLYRAYCKENMLDSALYHVERNIEIDPFDKRFFFDMAYVYKKKHDLDKVIDSYYRVLELDKNNVNAIKGLVSAFSKKKDYGNAITMQERLLKCSPNDNYARGRYVSLLVEGRKYSKALDYIEAILRKEKGNRMCITKLRLLLNMSASKAVHGRANSILRNPRYNSGESFLRKAQSVSYRNPRQAIKYIDEALSMGVDISEVASLRFNCLKNIVSDKQYINELNKFIKRYPKNADLKCVKGGYLISKDKKKAGCELLRRNLREFNDESFSANRLLMKYFTTETSETKAKEIFDYKISNAEKRKVNDYYQYMVHFYIFRRHFDKALNLLDKIDEMNINNNFVSGFNLSNTDRQRMTIYDLSKQFDKWLVLKKKQYGYVSGDNVPEPLVKELVRDKKYKEARILIGKTESKRYCWLDAILLLKKAKHKDAIKCLAKTLDKYKGDKELMKLINYDFVDLSYDFKTRYMRFYIKKMMREVIKPRL